MNSITQFNEFYDETQLLFHYISQFVAENNSPAQNKTELCV